MLKSELGKLQQLMEQLAGRQADAGQTYSRQEALINELQREIDRLQSLWTGLLFGPIREHTLTRYLQFHQAGLLLLLEEWNGKQDHSGRQTAGTTADSIVEQLLAGLLAFLKTKASRYFDQDQALSRYERESFRENASKMLDELHVELDESVSDPAFREMLTRVLKAAIGSRQLAGTTYRQADNLLHWITIIRHVLNERTATESLFQSLYRYNFNVPELFGWYEQFLSLKPAGTAPKAAALTRDQQVKSLRFITVDTRQAFLPGEPATSVLAGLLLSDADIAQNYSGQSEKHLQRKPMPLTLSVPQLGLFLRLCYLEGCFADPNISRLMRFFATRFSSKMSATISVKSLGRLFYTADLTTAATVRNILQRMVLQINKTYFP